MEVKRTDCVKNEEILQRDKDQGSVLHKIKERKEG